LREKSRTTVTYAYLYPGVIRMQRRTLGNTPLSYLPRLTRQGGDRQRADLRIRPQARTDPRLTTGQPCSYHSPFHRSLVLTIPGFRFLGQVAQLVEQRIENPRVAGSIPALATLAAFTNLLLVNEPTRMAHWLMLRRREHWQTGQGGPDPRDGLH
jgi:hypothetical protein